MFGLAKIIGAALPLQLRSSAFAGSAMTPEQRDAADAQDLIDAQTW
jgi:hypothetical protein